MYQFLSIVQILDDDFLIKMYLDIEERTANRTSPHQALEMMKEATGQEIMKRAYCFGLTDHQSPKLF